MVKDDIVGPKCIHLICKYIIKWKHYIKQNNLKNEIITIII